MRIRKGIDMTQQTYWRRPQAGSRLIAALFVSSLFLFAQGHASAQTTDTTIGQGVGTSAADVFGDGSNVQINTSVSSVTYSNPTRIHRNGLNYFEVTGSIRGTGWGGEWADLTGPAPESSANAHYSYDLPFVLRWAQNWDGTQVSTTPLVIPRCCWRHRRPYLWDAYFGATGPPACFHASNPP